VLLATLGPVLTTLRAFLAAAFAFFTGHALGATGGTFGTTCLGFLLLIGLRRALGHANSESGQQ
jgi:hypothetical protein